MYRLTYAVQGHTQTTELRQGIMIVGRGAGCDILIREPSVSGQHLRLDVGPEGVCFRDLLSRNGTHLNGARVTEGRLRSGDILRIGKVEMRFESDIPAAAEAKAASLPQPPPPAVVGEPTDTPVDLGFAPQPPAPRAVEVVKAAAMVPVSPVRPATADEKRKRLILIAAAAVLAVGLPAIVFFPSSPSPDGGEKAIPYWEKVNEGIAAYESNKIDEAVQIWASVQKQIDAKFAEPAPNLRTAGALADAARLFAQASRQSTAIANWAEISGRLLAILNYGGLEPQTEEFLKRLDSACAREDAAQRIWREAEALFNQHCYAEAAAKYDEIPSDSVYRRLVSERQRRCQQRQFEAMRDEALALAKEEKWEAAVEKAQEALKVREDGQMREAITKWNAQHRLANQVHNFQRLAVSDDPEEQARALRLWDELPAEVKARPGMEEKLLRLQRSQAARAAAEAFRVWDRRRLDDMRRSPQARVPEVEEWLRKAEVLARQEEEAKAALQREEMDKAVEILDAIRNDETLGDHPVRRWASQVREKELNNEILGEKLRIQAADCLAKEEYRRARRLLQKAKDRYGAEIAKEVEKIQKEGIRLYNRGVNAATGEEQIVYLEKAWRCFLPGGDKNDEKWYPLVTERLKGLGVDIKDLPAEGE